jgi:hypothetical protein
MSLLLEEGARADIPDAKSNTPLTYIPLQGTISLQKKHTNEKNLKFSFGYQDKRSTPAPMYSERAIQLSKDLRNLIENPEYADVSFHFDDGTSLSAHRCILSVRCPNLSHELDSDQSVTSEQNGKRFARCSL